MRTCRSVSLLCLALTGALAEEAAPAIIVTATKVDSEIGQVPASVAVASGQEIEDRGDRTLDDVVERMSNVHAINLGAHTTYPVIRGASGLADKSPTRVLVDGIAPRGLGFDSLLDVERVEMLRGPQGTLYGPNSIPGVVSIVTRDPGKVWNGNGEISAGNNRTAMASVAAGGPLNDALGVRLAARGAQSDGWRTNVIDDDDEAAKRRDLQTQAKLAWDIGAGWTARLAGIGARYRSTGDQFAPVELAHEHETQNSEEGEFSNRVLASGLTLEQRTDDRVFTAITGASDNHDVFDLDIDFSPLPGNTLRKETDNRQLSQEVRYASGSGLRSWLVGAYAAHDTEDVEYGQTITPGLNPFLPFTLVTEARGIQNANDLAVFAEAGIPLAPGWTFTAGLRADLTHTEVDFVESDNLTPGFTYADDRTDVAVLPKGVLSYAWCDDILTWLSASRGFTAGGYNLTPNTRDEIAGGGYDPETAWSYEIGQRAASLDRNVRVSLVGFWADYRDKQVVVLEPPQTYLIRNAARATVVGVESDNAVRLAPGVDLLLGAGALRATFDEYQTPDDDLSGNHLPMAPTYDAYLGLQWRHETGFVARGDVTAIGSSYADDRNQVTQESYQLLAARIGYEAEYWGVYLWGRNLADEVYWTRASVSPTAGAVAVSAEPRTFGVTGNARF